MTHSERSSPPVGPASPDLTRNRRGFFSRLLMLLGLGGAYGTLAGLAARYLYPAHPDPRGWLFAAQVARLGPGESLPYVTPAGDNVLITRQGEGTAASDFIALSSTCPHLGCHVHWEAVGARFFCPCHNGTFDKAGTATGGPPFADGKNLPRYPLQVENGLLFINVPLQSVQLSETRNA